MYSWEISNLLQKYNYNIPSDIYFQISNISDNPQITYIEYNAFSNKFKICTNDGYNWEFSVYKKEGEN